MKTFTASYVLFVLVGSVLAEILPQPKDIQEYLACKRSPNPATFAGIRYGDGPAETVQYNQCIPVQRPDRPGIISNAVFCRPASCFVFSNTDCAAPSEPVPVIVPVSIDVPNAVDFAELLGQSAICVPNHLP